MKKSRCFVCRQVKPLDEFYFLPSIDRLDKVCKQCKSKRGKLQREANKHWARLIVAQDGQCAECGEVGDLVIDHIKSVACGGSSDIENLRLLCPRCNYKKVFDDQRGSHGIVINHPANITIFQFPELYPRQYKKLFGKLAVNGKKKIDRARLSLDDRLCAGDDEE